MTNSNIIVTKKSLLFFNKKKYQCSIGLGGIKKNKTEGDGTTPSGKFGLQCIYYRKDRIKKLTSNLDLIPINKNMIWCDDPTHKLYNKQTTFKKKIKFSYERLFLKNNIYDIFIVIKYNLIKIRKFKGSAIFIHLADKNYKKTQGCIALKKKNLIEIIKKIKKNTKIHIRS